MMRIMCACATCLATATNGGPADQLDASAAFNARVPTMGFLLPENDGVYRFTCPRGHENIYLHQSEKFETLFEISLHAIIDGYYREAIATFGAALERFYEAAIDVLLIARSIPGKERSASWNKIKKQSERQLGAYVFTWLAVAGDLPPTLSDNEASFRNEVVHQGRICTKSEAIWFGNLVRVIIEQGIESLKTKFNDAVEKRQFEQSAKLRDTAGVNNAVVTRSTSAVSLSGHVSKSVEEWLKDRWAYRQVTDEAIRALGPLGLIIQPASDP
ncbi:hypothetical protein [Lysobacter enzymogenes]|uniref:hypothetical protein n=1 Tax=Lysobacter enzymogenes TaxID=69 RepID=UPI000F4BF935|nr:hypothetical protein [Lysobacter enzymogenes]